MTLRAGVRLGPYEVVSALGAGGMGEVYRAKDARLGRDVAIKVLPPHLSESPDARARFEREARAVAALSHAHIGALYDVGREGEVDYLVMELLEGETLAERVARGPLPLAELLRIGGQIADALDKAHRKGLIHRDLKPGNIMLTKSGAKLMDFGLARATGLGPSSDMTSSPTVTRPLTAEGTIVGTFHYMSPEQLEGKEADARSDLWALGATLYEMATGKRAFEGASQASLIAAIMQLEPRPISELQPATPAALDRLIRACLAKDPDERIQTAHDAKLQLQWIGEGGSQSGAGAPALPVRRRSAWLRWVAGVALAFIAAITLITWMVTRDNSDPVSRTAIGAPAHAQLAIAGDEGSMAAISPDGTRIIYAATGQGGGLRLWLRRLDDLTPHPLPGTEDGMQPFWSPDGRSIGFFANRKLKRLDVDGGAPVVLCDAPGGRGGSWSRSGMIVYAPEFTSGLWVVPAKGGTPRVLTVRDTTTESSHRWPCMLPDGKHLVFVAASHWDPDNSSLWFTSLDGKERRRLFSTPSSAIYSNGRLLFVRDSTLMVQGFDPGSGRLRGGPVATHEVTAFDPTTWLSTISVSEHDQLLYGTEVRGSAFRLMWFDRSGHLMGEIGEAQNHYSVNLSPEGRRVVIESQITPFSDLWVCDLASGVVTRVTNTSDDETSPAWSPDGTRLYFAERGSNENYSIRSMRADGIGGLTRVLEVPGHQVWPVQLIDGGRTLLYGDGDFVSSIIGELWRLRLDGSGHRERVMFNPPGFAFARVSPDGRWLAFSARISGRLEVYVAPMPPEGSVVDTTTGAVQPAGRLQISSKGGDQPLWRKDGHELYYLRPDHSIMAVNVDGSGAEFQVHSEQALFQAFQRNLARTFDVSADGQRFLVSVAGTSQQAPFAIVTHWSRTLKQP